MNSSFLLIVIAIIVIVTSSSSSTGVIAQSSSSSCSITVTQSFANLSLTTINKILQMHNDARRQTTPLATDMPMLSWNDKLAHHAEDWLKTCPPFNTHSSQQYRTNVAGFSYIGENLGSSTSNTLSESDLTIFIQMWIDERDYWTHQPAPCGTSSVCGTCATNPALGFPMCGHYTQMVSGQSAANGGGTTQVGCAYWKSCPDGSYRLNCLYGEGGNILGRQVYQAATGSNPTTPPCVTAVPHVIASRDGTVITQTPGSNPTPSSPNNGPGSPPISNGPNNAPPPSGGGDESNNNLGVIIGGAVGGVVALVLIAVAIVLIRRRNRSVISGDGVSQNYLFAQPAADPSGPANNQEEELLEALSPKTTSINRLEI